MPCCENNFNEVIKIIEETKSNKHKYGIKPNLCGVYKIENKITHDFYIGSSINISNRIGNHMNRDAKRYSDKTFYKDVLLYGVNNFNFEVLELCKPEDKISREQYWYDRLHPTYNMVRPTECNFIYEEVIRKLQLSSNDKKHIEERTKLLNMPKYKNFFRYEVHKKRMKPCECIQSDKILEFPSLRDAGRWVKEHTNYSSKNTASKIKSVCDGERKTASGYKWRYKEGQETKVVDY